MQINSINVPAWLLPELKTLIDSVPAQAIIRLARALPILRNGYRNSIAAAPLLRKQLYKLLVNETLHDNQKVNDVLRRYSLNQTMLLVLSRTVINELYLEILSYYGAERVLLATVLDGRSQVRERALPFLGDYEQLMEFGLSSTDHSNLKERLRPFLVLASELNTTATSSSKRARNAHPEQPCSKCLDILATKSNNKKLQRWITRLEKKQAQQDEQHQKDQQKIEKLRCQVQSLRNEQIEWEVSHTTLQASFKKHVHQRVRKINTRLQRDQNYTSSGTNLSDQKINIVEQRLSEEQVSTDRKHLCLFSSESDKLKEEHVHLQHSVAKFEDVIASLQHCIDSLKDNWREELVRDATNERQISVANFEKNYSDCSSTHDADGFDVRVCEGNTQVDDVLNESQDLQGNDILDSAEISRCKINAEKSQLQVYKEVDIKIRNMNRCGSLENLKNIGNALLIIDGYNVLAKFGNNHASIRNVKKAFTKGWRDFLINMTSMLLEAQLPKCESIIVFDGPEHQQKTLNDRLRVIYTDGGQSEPDQRADQHILQYLEFLRGDFDNIVSEQQACYVVTSDRALQRDIRTFDARTIEVDQFEQLLSYCNSAAKSHR